MKHVTTITKVPLIAANETSDLSFLLEILGLGLSLLTTVVGGFTTIFGGVLEALSAFQGIKNPSGT